MNLVCIHGFGGFPEDWQELVSQIPSVKNSVFLKIDEINEEISNKLPTPFYLLGYSMGGRLAILLAMELKKRNLLKNCNGLVLFSTGLGFQTERERQERAQIDENWANLLKKSSERFWQDWYEQDVFKNFKIRNKAKLKAYLDKKKNHDPQVLCGQLLRLSAARHEYLLPYLKELEPLKILYLAGEEDEKYKKIGELLLGALRNYDFKLVPGAGHSLLFENPSACANVLGSWFIK